MAEVTLKLKSGDEVTVDPGAPWTAREQIAWEEHFKASFVTVYQAIGAEVKAQEIAEAASEKGEAADVEAASFKVSWILWFAWYRARPKVASKFSTFIDDQLADYVFVEAPSPEEAPAAQGDGSLDPTPPPSAPAASPVS